MAKKRTNNSIELEGTSCNIDINVIRKCAKRLKDDSEAEITGDMIMDMIYSNTVNFADNIPMYLDMLKQNECVDKIQVLKTITNIENIFNL